MFEMQTQILPLSIRLAILVVIALVASTWASEPPKLQAISPDIIASDTLSPLNISNSFQLPNQTTIALNNSAEGNEFGFVCDGSVYGFNPDVQDCLGALDKFGEGRDRIKFAQRHTPAAEEENVFPLPWRWMGCRFYPRIVLNYVRNLW